MISGIHVNHKIRRTLENYRHWKSSPSYNQYSARYSEIYSEIEVARDLARHVQLHIPSYVAIAVTDAGYGHIAGFIFSDEYKTRVQKGEESECYIVTIASRTGPGIPPVVRKALFTIVGD